MSATAPFDPSLDSATLTEQGIAAYKAGDRLRARKCLNEAVKRDPQNEAAWLWLAGAHDDLEFRRICLEKVLALNPGNLNAKKALDELRPPARDTVFTPPRKGTGELKKPRTGPLPSVPGVVLKEKRCPWCGAVVPERRTHQRCLHCDHHLDFTCPACERDVPHDQVTCPYCNHAMGDFLHSREGYLARQAEAYRTRGWIDQALPVYGYLVEIAPRKAEYHFRLAQLHDQLGDTGLCIREYQAVLEFDPENVEALVQLGRWYMVLRQTHELKAISAYLRKIKHRSLRLNLLLGDVEYAREEYKEALRLYSEIVNEEELDAATRARVNFRLGEMYDLAGAPKRALGYLRAGLAAGLDNEETRAARRRADQLQPPLPPRALRSYSETARAMLGPVLVVWLMAAIHIGYQPRYLTPLGLVGLSLAVVGSYLVASAQATPLTPEWRELFGEAGLTQPFWKQLVTIIGGGGLALSVILILFAM